MHMQLLRPEEKEDTPTLPCCLYFNVGHKVNAMNEYPSKEFFDRFLNYNGVSGDFTWKKRSPDMFATTDSEKVCKWWNSRFSGKSAGIKNENLYSQIKINKIPYMAHRVALIISNGGIGRLDVDHINGIKSDNRISNLRLVTKSDNARNSKISERNRSGVVGVCWYSTHEKWAAYIRSDNRNIHLGFFDNIEDAARKRKEYEEKLGYHKNHGRKA